MLSNALFMGLSAILACCEMGGKLIFSGYASNGRNDGFGTIPMGERIGVEARRKAIFQHEPSESLQTPDQKGLALFAASKLFLPVLDNVQR